MPEAAMLAYVGCYTPGATKGAGSGVARVGRDPRTGSLTTVETTPMHNASWVAIDRRQRTLYALSEDEVYQNPPAGSVSAYSIDPHDFSLHALNTVRSGSRAPCYVSVHP